MDYLIKVKRSSKFYYFWLLLLASFFLNHICVNSVFALEKINENHLLLIDVFKELVEINTTVSIGNTTIASEAMAEYLLDAGLPKEDVKVLALNPNKGNLVARYRGTGKKKPLLLLAHIDVVEVKTDEWSFEPFNFTE